MSDLSDDARSLLAHAKRQHVVDPAAVARLRERVMLRAGASAAVGACGAALATKTAPAAKAAAWLLTAKTLGGLALAGVVATGGIAIERHFEAPTAAHGSPPNARPRVQQAGVRQATPATELEVRPATPARAAFRDENHETPLAPPSVFFPTPAREATTRIAAPTTSSVVASRDVDHAQHAQDQAVATGREAATAPSWEADLALLHDAQSSIADGDPRRAHDLAVQITERGPFREERAALLAIADCRAARQPRDPDVDWATQARAEDAARRQAAAFTEIHDGSALADRVRAACAQRGASIP